MDAAYHIEMLTILNEELAEVIQASSKCMRFGYDSEYDGETAKDRLEKELGDLQCLIDLLHEHDVISFSNLDKYANMKREKLKKWSDLYPE